MRFSAEEISAFKRQVWENVNALLVDSKRKMTTTTAEAGDGSDDDDSDGKGMFWLLGGKAPSEADAALFGFVAAGLVCAA